TAQDFKQGRARIRDFHVGRLRGSIRIQVIWRRLPEVQTFSATEYDSGNETDDYGTRFSRQRRNRNRKKGLCECSKNGTIKRSFRRNYPEISCNDEHQRFDKRNLQFAIKNF